MAAPRVAVVMPLHNVEVYVDEALAGIASQTRQPNEVVIVDDASTDGTVERVKAWTGRLPLTLIELDENIGCGAARSRAIREASADIIAPHDGDDVWLPHHLETTAPLVRPDVIAATKPLRWSGKPSDPGTTGWHDIPPADRQAEAIVSKNFLFSGSLYWRTTLEQAGGPSGRRLAEDYETWTRLLLRARCHAVSPTEPTVRYRQRPDSLSADERCLLAVADILETFVHDDSLAVPRPVIERALRRVRSRRKFLDGLEMADNGQLWEARRVLVNAAVSDRSFSGGMATAEQGSVTLRALAALVSPRAVAAGRRQRLRQAGLVPSAP